MSTAIPEGFRLGPGWECSRSPSGEPWECNAYLGHGEECKADAPYLHARKSQGACSAHAVSLGALVPVAPVVEALKSAEKVIGMVPGSLLVQYADEVSKLRAALATAEQRAAAAEDKLARIGSVMSEPMNFGKLFAVADILQEGK